MVAAFRCSMGDRQCGAGAWVAVLADANAAGEAAGCRLEQLGPGVARALGFHGAQHHVEQCLDARLLSIGQARCKGRCGLGCTHAPALHTHFVGLPCARRHSHCPDALW